MKPKPIEHYIKYAKQKAVAHTISKMDNQKYDVCETCLNVSPLHDNIILCNCTIFTLQDQKEQTQ